MIVPKTKTNVVLNEDDLFFLLDCIGNCVPSETERNNAENKTYNKLVRAQMRLK